jgi:hypothetical protein
MNLQHSDREESDCNKINQIAELHQLTKLAILELDVAVK